MFRCFQTCRGSGHKKAKSSWLGRFWRRLIRPLTHLRHASRSEPKVCCENEQEPDSMPNHPRFDYKSREYVQQMIDYIPAAIQNRDHLCLDIFVAMYRTYATTWEVLDLLMKTAIFSFLFGWFQKFPQDFYESPDLAVLSQFTEYVRLNVPFGDGDTQARDLLSMFKDQEAITLKLEEDCATTPDPPEQDVSGRQDTLALRPASMAEPQGDKQSREDTELVKRAVLDPFEPKAAIELLPTLEQALPTSADTHSPVDVAADEAADVAADEAADVSPARQLFVPYTVPIDIPDFVFPLPEVDI